MSSDNTKSNTKKTVAQIVTERIIEKIKTAESWSRPWQTYNSINWATCQEYTGINRWLLSGGEYMTMIQGRKNGFSVKKGAKTNIIVRVIVKKYYTDQETLAKRLKRYNPSLENMSTKELMKYAITRNIIGKDEKGHYAVSKRLRYYTVFEISDFIDKEGNAPVSRFTTNHVEEVFFDNPENVINNYLKREGITVQHTDRNKAYYSSSFDFINMPERKQFITKSNSVVPYYSTFFHEMSHSTGHPTRLNRKLGNRFGSPEYSFEELIAELSASMLCRETGIMEYDRVNYDENEMGSAAYIKSWCTYLEENTDAIIKAANLAEKAKNYILQWSNDNIISDEVEES